MPLTLGVGQCAEQQLSSIQPLASSKRIGDFPSFGVPGIVQFSPTASLAVHQVNKREVARPASTSSGDLAGDWGCEELASLCFRRLCSTQTRPNVLTCCHGLRGQRQHSILFHANVQRETGQCVWCTILSAQANTNCSWQEQ